MPYDENLPKVCDLEFQFENYCRLVGLDTSQMHAVQLTETRRAFFGGLGGLVAALLNELAEVKSHEYIQCMQNVTDQVREFWDVQGLKHLAETGSFEPARDYKFLFRSDNIAGDESPQYPNYERMIQYAHATDDDTFLLTADLSTIKEPEEDALRWVARQRVIDKDSKAYISSFDEKKCIYFQVGDIKYIFVKQD